jgi:DNA-3-methyladenine glycosylase II
MGRRISKATLKLGLDELAGRDPDIARVYAEVGLPPTRRRPADFATLLGIICAQQLSRASADAILGRLNGAARPLEPATFLALDDQTLRRIGFSRQKIAYGRALAADIAEGRLDLGRLGRLDDEAAITELTKVKGIGRWSAEVYLMFALGRADLWPVDDLAVVTALGRFKGLPERPTRAQALEIGEAWRPWRSAAARLLWHYYRTTPAGPA